MAARPFRNHRAAALALLTGETRLTRKAGQFLGQLAVDATPLSEAQAEWLAKLLARAGLPPLHATGTDASRSGSHPIDNREPAP